MSNYDRSQKTQLDTSEAERTFRHPATGAVMPYDFVLTEEQENKLTAMADALVEACEELGVPVHVILQTSNTPDDADIVRRGILPGPRCGSVVMLVNNLLERVGQ